MRILVVSDLHCEFHRDHGDSMIASLPLTDVIVLAGDIATPALLSRVMAKFCAKWPHVVYTAGNHEFYTSSPTKVHRQLEIIAATTPNFHWLNNTAITVAGQRFIGAPLWFSRFPDWQRLQSGMNDFHLIKDFNPWVFDQNHLTREYLDKEILPTDIVVTHYLPSQESVDPQWQGSPLNGFFVCDVSDMILEKEPKFWIHGHTHTSCRYSLGKTQVVCNPFGYAAQEENPRFNPNLIIEV